MEMHAFGAVQVSDSDGFTDWAEAGDRGVLSSMT